MARCENLPIWHAGSDAPECRPGARGGAVSAPPKYAQGAQSRHSAQSLLSDIVRAAPASTLRPAERERLALPVEHRKGPLTMARELGCYGSFHAWTVLAALVVGVGNRFRRQQLMTEGQMRSCCRALQTEQRLLALIVPTGPAPA